MSSYHASFLLLIGAAMASSFSFTSSLLATSTSLLPPRIAPSPSHASSSSLRMNLLDDLGNMLSGGALEAQSSLPYGKPFCTDTSCGDGVRTFAVRERPLSFTGEDFDVAELTEGKNRDFARVRGAMLHLPGKDKMRIRSSQTNEEVAVLDRVLISALPSYDIYRGGMGAEKIGWIEKKLIAMTDTFDVYMEGKGGFGITGMFKPKPAYQISGDFIDRNFVVKNEDDQTVAKVKMDGLVQFDAWNHYQVQVAPGMDAMLVLACCCAIDEEFDEEHQERKRREQGEE
mmetsp:Transcript_23558/g.51086  ORF Transcript_23558/g.51086 Transcript_23558/m.51086 type:complete len:286 (-) Transcript_23558:982-1839(-)